MQQNPPYVEGVTTHEDIWDTVDHNADDTETRVGAAETKLAGIEPGATADQTGSEIKSLYEAQADTNGFTDAEKAKLAALTTNILLTGADSTTQTAPGSGLKKIITINATTGRGSIIHTLGTGIFEITKAGWYTLIVIPQLETGGGGAGKVELSWEIDTGSGYATIAGSPVQDSVASSSELAPVCEIRVEMAIGDKVRSMWATDSASINIMPATSLVGDTIPSAHVFINEEQ